MARTSRILRKLRLERGAPQFVVAHLTTEVKVGKNGGTVTVKDRTVAADPDVSWAPLSQPGHWAPYTNPARDQKPGVHLVRGEAATYESPVPDNDPDLRRPRPLAPGRQVTGAHPWRDRLHAARATIPSLYLKVIKRPLMKGYGVAWVNHYGLGYDCRAEDCGFGIRNGNDPDIAGFWDGVTEHEDEHRQRDEQLVEAVAAGVVRELRKGGGGGS